MTPNWFWAVEGTAAGWKILGSGIVYPEHWKPDFVHLKHSGLRSSHLTRRFLQRSQPVLTLAANFFFRLLAAVVGSELEDSLSATAILAVGTSEAVVVHHPNRVGRLVLLSVGPNIYLGPEPKRM